MECSLKRFDFESCAVNQKREMGREIETQKREMGFKIVTEQANKKKIRLIYEQPKKAMRITRPAIVIQRL
jgi:hypothetical protein